MRSMASLLNPANLLDAALLEASEFTQKPASTLAGQSFAQGGAAQAAAAGLQGEASKPGAAAQKPCRPTWRPICRAPTRLAN
ncbi:MAG: hypothetical protein HC848_10605 [Limnobacter sp.]|nr:hypothetical protein [Limnobacter sp.]